MTARAVSVPGLFASGVVPHAVVSEGWVFASGVLGTVDSAGSMPSDFRAQANAAFRNLLAELGAAGADAASIVQITVYLADIEFASEMNEVYAQVFDGWRPTRTTVGVQLVQPALIEVNAIAFPGAPQ